MRRVVDQGPPVCRRSRSAAGRAAHARTGRRLPDVRAVDGPPEGHPTGRASPHETRRRAGRQGALLAGHPRPPANPRHHRGHPRIGRPEGPPPPARITRRAAGLLRPGRPPRPQRRRTSLLPPQAMARTGDPLRQARHHLPRRSGPQRRDRMDPTSVGRALGWVHASGRRRRPLRRLRGGSRPGPRGRAARRRAGLRRGGVLVRRREPARLPGRGDRARRSRLGDPAGLLPYPDDDREDGHRARRRLRWALRAGPRRVGGPGGRGVPRCPVRRTAGPHPRDGRGLPDAVAS